MRIAANVAIALLAIWFGLVDHCLVTASGADVNGKVMTLLVYQLLYLGSLGALVNGAIPTVSDYFRDNPKEILTFCLAVVPTLVFVFSPHLLSQTLHEQQFGPMGARNHPLVWRDLKVCCLPF
jgi:hypothetical protein